MSNLDTNIDMDEYREKSFLAGIALEKCKRDQQKENYSDTADYITDVATGHQFGVEKIAICNSLYVFMVKSEMAYAVPPSYNWQRPITAEGYLKPHYDSWGLIELSDRVCFLPSPPSQPLSYIVDVSEDLKEYLMKAISLVYKHFSNVSMVDVQKEQDPETEEEWIVIEATVDEEIEQVLDEYDNYTTEWVSVAPWPERERIRFSYNII